MKRALIITYYWPPAGGPGVQRWLQFVKHFREFGIEPVVYVPENPHYPLLDPGFSSYIADDVEVIRHPIKEPYRLAGMLSKKKTRRISSGIISEKNQSLTEKLLLFIRGNLFIPDARVAWVKPSVEFLTTYINNNPIEILITTGPPHSLHLIGMQLKEKFKLNWLADFRDPWTTIHYHKSLRLLARSKKKHKKLEAKVLREADVVVVTSPTTKKEFQKITKNHVEVITNGFMPAENLYPSLDRSFSIAHIGSLLSERNPNILWNVLAELSSEIPTFKEDLKIKLIGNVSERVIESISEFGLKTYTDILGYVSHSEALQLQHNAQLLLLLEIDSRETRSIIPGKLFEYLAAHRPIIALGPLESDIQAIIEDTRSGYFFNYNQAEILKDCLIMLYKDFKDGSLKIDSQGIEKYSRRELTRQMAELINRI